jgi:hypothetical protein
MRKITEILKKIVTALDSESVEFSPTEQYDYDDLIPIRVLGHELEIVDDIRRSEWYVGLTTEREDWDMVYEALHQALEEPTKVHVKQNVYNWDLGPVLVVAGPEQIELFQRYTKS